MIPRRGIEHQITRAQNQLEVAGHLRLAVSSHPLEVREYFRRLEDDAVIRLSRWTLRLDAVGSDRRN